MNLTLGSGDEENGRPLLGGTGDVVSGSHRSIGGGALALLTLETIARVAITAARSGFGVGSGGLTDRNPDIHHQ